MAAVTCKYHPQTPARWRCDSCQINFCPDCIKTPVTGAPGCPVCKHELASIGAANLIKPFWSRLRSFFIYPLYPGPMVVMLVLSVIAFLLYHVPGWGHTVNFLFFDVQRNFFFKLPFEFVFLKYAQSVLEDTAHGHLKPRPLAPEQLTENGMIVVKLFGLLLVFTLIEFAALDLFNMAVLQVVHFVLTFATPAAIMVLVMEDKLLKAIDPMTVGTVMLRIGPPYLVLFVLLYLLDAAQGTLVHLLPQSVSPIVGETIYDFVSMYFFLIIANMMGYLLYQHHEELGFSIEVEMEQAPSRKASSREAEVSPEMRAVEILIHEGKSEEAARQLEGLISNSPRDIEARERLLKLLRLLGDVTRHREQGQAYISMLLGENKVSQAAKVFQACLEYDNQFKPQKPGERLELGKFLRQNNAAKLAVAVLNNLHRDFPSYENIPEAYLIVAQMMCEKFNQDDRARQVLEFLLQNYPTHPMRDAVQDYLKVVNGLSAH